MAYGRLEIYWPDGRIESYMLSSPTVSVGRAEGNTIPLDSDTISRYHFSIVQDGDTVSITDLASQNGTYVDGMLLAANQAEILGGVEEIQAGALRIIFRQMDDSPTLAMSPMDDTARMEREEAHVRLEFDINTIDVWPASSSSSELAITNTSKETRRYSIRVSGLPGEWLRVSRSEIELLAEETAYVLIQIKPPRRPTTKPASYILTIEVAPSERPDLTLTATLDVNVKTYSGFGMAIAPQAQIGDPVSVFLHNQGSGTLNLALTALDPNKALKFKLPTAPLKLDAGQRLRVDVEINAKNPPLTGKAVAYPFHVQVRADNAAHFLAVAESKVQIAPRFPLWTLISGLGIALSILVIALLAMLGVLNPPNPQLRNISINAEQIALGDSLIIALEAQDVETLRLVSNGQTLQDYAGTASQIELDTSLLGTGSQMVELIGLSGSRTTSQMIPFTVYQPINITSFTVEPNRLLRNVTTNLRLAWNVEGAVTVQIRGLSDFSNRRVLDSTEYDAQDTIEGIGGIPTESLELTLYAQDAVGNPFTQNLVVPIQDPQCRAEGAIALYELPNTAAQQVGTVSANATVIVSAQDAEAGWLSVELEGGTRGWGVQDSFDCDFNLSDLRTEYNLPPLLPTLTPSPEATPDVD